MPRRCERPAQLPLPPRLSSSSLLPTALLLLALPPALLFASALLARNRRRQRPWRRRRRHHSRRRTVAGPVRRHPQPRRPSPVAAPTSRRVLLLAAPLFPTLINLSAWIAPVAASSMFLVPSSSPAENFDDGSMEEPEHPEIKVFQAVGDIKLPNPFLRLTCADAMDRYGTDRPDLRFGWELKDVSDVFLGSSFKVFADTLENGGVIKGIVCSWWCHLFSNTDLKKGTVYTEASKARAKGLPFLKVMENGELEGVGPLVSSLKHEKKEQLMELLDAKAGDLILFALGEQSSANRILGR